MKEAIIVGWINKGRQADCGETMKNQLLISRLTDLGIHCRQMDFKRWRKHPWVFLQLAWNMLFHKKATLIFATSAQNVYPLMRVMKIIGWKQNTVHWVIGGSLGQKVGDGIYKKDVIGYMRHTLVESDLMVRQLETLGLKGIMKVPNFKPIEYYPSIPDKNPRKEQSLKFVFLSRIMPEKGCDYILEAARLLNEEGYLEKYSIDFYGKVADTYQTVFFQKLVKLSNVQYCGFLNLKEAEGYDKLATYDVMLFPTCWKGEGFAGVFIDAFICGLPIIATRWAHNEEFLEENKTALFVPSHNVVALHDRMMECINNVYNLTDMSLNSRNESEKYNVRNVVTEDLLKEVEII